MRGVVYRDENQKLFIMTVDERLKVEDREMADTEGFYGHLEFDTGDIVMVDRNEAVGLVSLKSIALLKTTNNGVPCAAWEQLRYAAEHNVPALKSYIDSAVIQEPV